MMLSDVLHFFFSCKGNITEDDVIELADLMKSDMEDTLKIQRSPWLDSDVLEFEDVYLPVGLEKETPGKRLSAECVKDYKDLFVKSSSTAVSDSKRRKAQRHKILIKGDPGVGKTTVVSKIAYDWAVSTWNVFSLVFFISLKVVKPGDLIENIIIDENVVPSVYAEEYDIQKIDTILKTYGNKCLLILEGFDEFIGKNKDIINIIKGLKYASSNIIVTTRPHVADIIQRCFTSVVNVTGFTKDDAQKYIRTVLEDQSKVESVLRFMNENQTIGIHEMWRYPILLLFICILVNDDGGYLDLNDRNVTLTDIYSKLHECLYKRYTIKWGVKFSTVKMKHTLVQLGKLALKGLQQARLLYQKSELEKEVGKDAFRFGIIIGYQDKRVIHDLSADCTVCFLHKSIQEYLAAFYVSEELQRSDRRIEDMWPDGWDNSTVSRVPTLLVFAIDLCNDRSIAKNKLLHSMAHVLNQKNITIHGNLLGKNVMSFLALVTQQCPQPKCFTFVNTRIPDDIEAVYNFMIGLSKNISKITFTQCKFQKAYDLKCSNLSTVSNHIIDLEFKDSEVPVATLKFLSQKEKLLNSLTLDHTDKSLKNIDVEFYKDLLDLLASPLPSLKSLHINTTQQLSDNDVFLYDEQPCDLDDIKDMTKYVGNLPNVKEVMIKWFSPFGRIFCDALCACLQGNQCLENFVAGFEFEMCGSTEMSKHVLSPSLSNAKYILLWDRSPWVSIDKKHTLEARKKVVTDLPKCNALECTSSKLPQILMLKIDGMLLFEELDIHNLLGAINGSNTLRILKINNIILPFMASILQSKGLPELTDLGIEYHHDMSREPQFRLPEKEAAINCLPKLTSLEFKKLHGVLTIPQILLKNFFVAVRGSHCLTVLDISGQNAAACLKSLLFPEGLLALTEFKADDCGLLPVDVYRLGKAAKTNKLPSLKQISLSKNPKISNYVCYIFIGNWPLLEVIALDRIDLTSWDTTCLAHAATRVKTNDHILPNLKTILCNNTCASALKKQIDALTKQMMTNTQISLWNKGLTISTPSIENMLMLEIEELQKEISFGAFTKEFKEYAQQIVDKLLDVTNEDMLWCYGAVRLQIIEFITDIYRRVPRMWGFPQNH